MNLLEIEDVTPIAGYSAFLYASIIQNWCQTECGQFSYFSHFSGCTNSVGMLAIVAPLAKCVLIV